MNTFSLFSSCDTCEVIFTPNGELVTVTIGRDSHALPLDRARAFYRGLLEHGYTTEKPALEPLDLPATEWDMSIDEADAIHA